MRYVVHGAGAVGGTIGGRLHLAGLPVTLVARRAHLEAIRSAGGLVLDAGDGRHLIDAPVAGTAAEVDWTDDTVVVLAVKSHQAPAALADLREHAPPGVAVVCATNGIATEVAALRFFARTYAVCVMLPATHLEPGVVVAACHPTPAILDIGRIPGGTDATTAAVATDLRAAGIASEERGDILAWKRRKLLMNLGNGVDASFAQGEAADRLAEHAVAEGERVLAAAGVSLATADEDTARRGSILQRRPGLERRGGSTWQSLSRGTGDSEIDYLAGEIVLQGRLHGVPTPVNEAVVAATRRLAYAGSAPRSLDAADVLASL
ncbi:2-dehydropantoate 2-reductase [Nocardioides alpinus]|uniref:2-dehydropantoate 2-reductase n=1 Tax=Nocardioides alpinus TaxID=748909 RepID=A0A1I0YN10_9ACTN|nr:2-dehydropantoate 2-reductase N-terminal domain-containing protein [Nocardioides alpinus]PKH43604.1 ketopantoate reductase family protein [Nocardioides alpinus]SFB14166.1 2-dehydropantoate 2-reductase [Nocardioides alpinus]